MITEPEYFETRVNGVFMKFQELDLPGYTAFNVTFSSKRMSLIVARAKNADHQAFWTSIPEGRQKEAEGVGKLIEEHFKTKETK
jgi:hypothetical protein